jgi:glyoxylase-like metal-dependent hydrolase (beta-lactamase superfamily II)
MCAFGGRLVSGEGGLRDRAPIVCHCLLIETADSLVLVDTGLGTGDCASPRRRLGLPFVTAFGVQADGKETAVAQIGELGLDPADVRHIVATHLDLDHAGGLPDFPEAEVHVFKPEHDAAVNVALRDRPRYRRCHFRHDPRWATHIAGGDRWFGFESIRAVPGTDHEVLLIPLVGHSRGHTGVAVRGGERWLLHCGDAYFHHDEVATPPSCPPGLRAFQVAMAADGDARRRNQERLRELAREHGDEVELFCSHDPVELERVKAAAR